MIRIAAIDDAAERGGGLACPAGLRKTAGMSGYSRPFSGRIADGDIRLLRVFRAIVERGGFAAAESELQIGLPAISRSIKDLETRFGMRLCNRGRAGFSLTEQGRGFHEASLRFLDDIERFEAEIRGVHVEASGVLEIGVVDTLLSDPQFRLPEMIATFKAAYPRISINISVQTSNRIEQGVIDGGLQIGLIFGRRRIAQLRYRPLHSEISYLYCAASHPLADRLDGLTPVDLGEHDYVGYSFTDDVDRLYDRELKGVLRPAAGVDHMEGAATLIATGHYIGFLPEHYVTSLRRCAGFRRILPDIFAFTTDIEIITRQGTQAHLVGAFLRTMEPSAAPGAPAALRLAGR